jgi:iron complex transport system substrate-binding protein
MAYPPQRIVCLTEETVETLYLLGEDARIVGVSGYAVRPARVRREKPRVSAFVSADVAKILALEPDLVLAFSDIQAPIVADLMRAGVAVHGFNQRTLAGIFDMIAMVAGMVGASERGERLIGDLKARLDHIQVEASRLDARPRVYFEEWDEPMISAIGWVSELIAIAGGQDVFGDLAREPAAKNRTVTPQAVVDAAPDVIIGSWCGKKFRPEKVCARPGFEGVPAVVTNQLFEIKAPLILQPGPAALTDGLDALAAIVAGAARKQGQS